VANHGRESEADSSWQTQRATLTRREAGGTEPRINELVDSEVDECEAGAHQGNADSRWHEPVPLIGKWRVVRLRPVEHRAPIPHRRARQSDVGERHVGANRVKDGEEQRRGQDGKRFGAISENMMR